MVNPLTVREQVSSAILAALQGRLTGVTVERNRREGVGADEAPYVVLFDGDQSPSYDNTGLTTYVAEFGIEATVTADADSELGAATNDLYGQIVFALMRDASLNGICVAVRESGLSVNLAPPAESSRPLMFFSVSLEVEFITMDGNPTSSYVSAEDESGLDEDDA